MDYVKMAKFIEPLYMDGLHGRMLRMPSQTNNKREILLVYGHHASLERMFSFAEVLSQFGAITMPDLPGFGGMESFYKINQRPSIDTYADYLAAFVKLRYKHKRVVLIGFSYSVPILVRMLQKYPELAKKVDCMISIVGFVHKEDFALSRKYIFILRTVAKIGSRKLPAFFLKNFIFRGFLIRLTYHLVAPKHDKMKDADRDERRKRIDFEVILWTVNDLRTWMQTMGEMFSIDLCVQAVHIPLHHIAPRSDVYFDNNVVEQHMRIIFEDFYSYETAMPNHAPSIIASSKDIEPFFPIELQKVLEQL